MAKNIPQTPQARAARDALLKRADWIVKANIQAACGYVPVLPPDLVDFNLERAAEPNGAALAALLKGVMPTMVIKDDRAPHMIPPSDVSPLERCRWFIRKHAKGSYSYTELEDYLRIEQAMMESQERAQLVEYLTNAKKANPQKFTGH